MQFAFTVGLIAGIFVGIPIFAAPRPFATLGIHVGATLCAAFVLGQFDTVQQAVERWSTIVTEYPAVIAGFAFGLLLVGLVRAALHRTDKDTPR